VRFRLNRDRAEESGGLEQAVHEQSCGAGAQQKIPTLVRKRAHRALAPSKGELPSRESRALSPGQTILNQAACIEGLWPHSHVQATFPSSLSGGNTW